MIDGYGGRKEILNNKEVVFSALEELPNMLKMHPLAAPQVSFAPANNLKDPGGWSGYVIIAESHISIHTFPKRGFISADVYTCQNGLDRKSIEEYFSNKFELSSIESNFVIRGKKYPDSNIA